MKMMWMKKKTTCLLSLALVGPLILMVNAAKVGHDDGNWQGDDQHSAKRTNAAHHFAGYRLWDHVAVPATKEEI